MSSKALRLHPGGPRELEEIAASEFQEGTEAWQLQNLLGAMRIFLRSAQKGYQVGEYCFRWGQYNELPPSDIKQALRWYSRGARMNHKGSLTMLGKLHYAMGQKDKAEEWLQRTAAPRSYGGETGDSLAQWFMGEMSFQAGELRKAVRWWKRSAENGDSDAMMRLFVVFSQGASGIPQEPMLGRHWLLAAAAHGHQEALSRVSWPSSPHSRPQVERIWLDQMQDKGW